MYVQETENKSLIIMKLHHSLSDGLGLIQMFSKWSGFELPVPPTDKISV